MHLSFFSRVSMTMHTEHDIVLPILSVHLFSVGTVSKRMDTLSHFFDIQMGHRFLSHTTITKFQEDPSVGALKVQGWENLANIAFYLENGTR